MKKKKMIAFFVCAMFMISVSFNLMASEDQKNEKKTIVKFHALVDGKNVKWDTSFVSSGEKVINISKYLTERFHDLDSSDFEYVSIFVNDHCGDVTSIFSPVQSRVIKFGEVHKAFPKDSLLEVLISGRDSMTKLYSKNVVAAVKLNKDLHLLQENLADIHYRIYSEANDKPEHVLKVEFLKDKIKDIEHSTHILHAGRANKVKGIHFHHPGHLFMGFVLQDDLNENDLKLLKDAGLKLSDNTLDVEHMYLYSDKDGKFNLKFTLETDGKTSIKVISSGGKELFTDKVVYFPGTYDKSTKIDANEDDAYYIYIEQNGESFTTKYKKRY